MWLAEKLEKRMHPYMVWEGSEPGEGAALVFADTARAAKKAGWASVGWLMRDDYTEFHVLLCREHVDYLMGLHDGIHQVIDAPPTCQVCERWGAPMRPDGDGCENCGGKCLSIDDGVDVCLPLDTIISTAMSSANGDEVK
jgi:hypothetical protein